MKTKTLPYQGYYCEGSSAFRFLYVHDKQRRKTTFYENGNLITNIKGGVFWDPVDLKGVNIKTMDSYKQMLESGGKYNLLFNSCVSQTSISLNLSGVFNVGDSSIFTSCTNVFTFIRRETNDVFAPLIPLNSIMKVWFYILIALSFSSCYTSKNIRINELKEIWFYDYFDSKGYRVGGVYRQFQILEKDSIEKIKLCSNAVRTFNSIIHTAEMKNDFLGKLGGPIVFVIGITHDEEAMKIAILNNIIIDCTDQKKGYKFYFIKKEQHQKWISEFKNKIKNR